MHKAIQDLKAKGWTVTEAKHHAARLPIHVTERYKRIPDELLDVLSGIEECVAPDEKAWLLCQPDFEETSDSAFKWNGFELLSLEAADDDEELKARDHRVLGPSPSGLFLGSGRIQLRCCLHRRQPCRRDG